MNCKTCIHYKENEKGCFYKGYCFLYNMPVRGHDTCEYWSKKQRKVREVV